MIFIDYFGLGLIWVKAKPEAGSGQYILAANIIEVYRLKFGSGYRYVIIMFLNNDAIVIYY